MSTPETIKGLWWITGKDQPARSGTLNISSTDLRLSIWEHQQLTVEEVVLRAAQDETQHVSRVVYGRDEHDKPVTLFGCSIGEWGFSAGLQKFEIDALAAVRGLEIESWSTPIARAVLIRPGLLHRWLGRNLIVSSKTEDGKAAFIPVEGLDLLFPLEPGIKIRFCEVASPSSSSDEFRFCPDSQIWFHFDEPRSISEIRDLWVPWVTRLLGLLIGTAVWKEEVRIFTVDPFEKGISIIDREGELLPIGSRTGPVRLSDPHARNMVAPFEAIREQLGGIVAEWHRVCRRLKPVVDLFATVSLHHNMFMEARFLFLVQTLEIYHVCSDRFESRELPKHKHEEWLAIALEALPANLHDWAKGKLQLNFRSLFQKLVDIFKAHEAEAVRLFGNLEEAASRIAYTRNYYTHYHEDADKGRLIPERKMFGICFALEAMLWLILLRELKLEGRSVESVVRRAEGLKFVLLDS